MTSKGVNFAGIRRQRRRLHVNIIFSGGDVKQYTINHQNDRTLKYIEQLNDFDYHK